MSDIKPVTQASHGARRWKRPTSYDFAASHALVPLVAIEMPRAALSLPVGFLAQGDGFLPVAVLGIKPGENLLVASDGRWLAAYVPAALRCYPFMLVPLEGGKEMLCMDEESGLIVDGPEGEPFFDESKEPSRAIGGVMSFLQQVNASSRATRTMCACLKEHNLIQPWPILVEGAAGGHRLQGLYRVDEAALDNLPGEAFLKVRASGALPMIYSQLLSMQHLHALRQFAALRAGAAAALSKLPVSSAGELDLEFLNAEPVMDFNKPR